MGFDVTDVGLDNSSTVHEIKKHAAIIHCSNTLSLLQRKITNALLYHAYKELMQKEEHEITVKQLCKLISYQGNNHSAIKDALKGLLSTVLEWNVVNDTTGVEDWTASSILASVSLKGPNCLFAYSPRMKQLLHSPSMFGKVNLLVQSRFKSSYGLALYENCIRYRGLPYTKWFELDVFRKLMGVPAGKYSVFRDFKKRVLDKSVEEVNSYAEIFVESELFREGKKVTKVRFSLKERAKKTRIGATQAAGAEISPQDTPQELLKTKLITQFDFSDEQVQQVMRDYEMDFIQEKILVIESSKNYQTGKVHNIAGYLVSALKNNYQMSKSGRLPAPAKTGLITKDAQRMIEKMKDEYNIYKDEVIDQILSELPEKDNFMKRFFEHAADIIQMILKLQRKKYTKDTILQSPQVKALLRQFTINELALTESQISSFATFVKKYPKKYQSAWEKQELLEQD